CRKGDRHRGERMWNQGSIRAEQPAGPAIPALRTTDLGRPPPEFRCGPIISDNRPIGATEINAYWQRIEQKLVTPVLKHSRQICIAEEHGTCTPAYLDEIAARISVQVIGLHKLTLNSAEGFTLSTGPRQLSANNCLN